MILPRHIAALACLALSACGSDPAPEAAPGSVERTTEALDRDTADEREATIRSNERDAKERADAAARRIEPRR